MLNYVFSLTKFLAVMMIVFVTLIGYFVSFTPGFNWTDVLHLIVGVGLSSAGALALNQYYERDLDALMERTIKRVLPSQKLKPRTVWLFGMILMNAGYIYLWYYLNGLCSLATILCGMIYLYLYTPLKTRSTLSTFFGSIPGALLPIMGWLAKYDSISDYSKIFITHHLIIVLLALMLFLWQIPHALIITIRYKNDYMNAGMKQLPIVMGDKTAYRHIFFNIILMAFVMVIPYLSTYIKEVEYVYVSTFIHGMLLLMFVFYLKKKTSASLIIFYRSLLFYLPLILCLLLLYVFKSVDYFK
ncbi:MAG: hypothetical protein COA79_04255 [Planctomycetota bacterium]|nr:MAG: hypothetical protein COA79_04255 [Planctomycetota bacterium]